MYQPLLRLASCTRFTSFVVVIQFDYYAVSMPAYFVAGASNEFYFVAPSFVAKVLQLSLTCARRLYDVNDKVLACTDIALSVIRHSFRFTDCRLTRTYH